jgi:putative ATP-dependent endonuclease of OLD family
MRLKSIRIQNFRSFRDETIHLDPYTCLVGSNGAGKSAVLTALNVFFRNNASTSTDIHRLSVEDFHHRNTDEPVTITLTFGNLSAEAQADFEHYYRQDKLTITARAQWDAATGSADVRQFGARMVMPEFAPFFEALDSKLKVSELKEIYGTLREKHPDLPEPGTKDAMTQALREFEEAHPEHCKLVDDPNQFYGWSKGANLLTKYVHWIYIPAVKDASTEQEEGSQTALGQLLERTVRAKIKFTEPIAELKKQLENEYKKLIDKEKVALAEVESAIHARLKRWASPAALLSLNWYYDSEKSLVVKEPVARVAIGEDDFVGEVARLGHGMQRSFLLSILQELAESNQEASPTLLLGFEEPELYQHPPQAQHIASILEDLATTDEQKTQVVITTHSPYFVSAKGFESVRMLRKRGDGNRTVVSAATYQGTVDRLAAALEDKPCSPTTLMAKVEQIMQPSQRELYFSKIPILVEGVEDVAFISTHLALTEKWGRFRELGCHFVICDGKSQMSRPLAIANSLEIPAFVVFDSDADCSARERENNRRDNACLLRLCGLTEFDPLPTEDLWAENVVMWKSKIGKIVKENTDGDEWEAAISEARGAMGFDNEVGTKCNLLISAALEKLDGKGIRSAVLTRLCDQILKFAESASN